MNFMKTSKTMNRVYFIDDDVGGHVENEGFICIDCWNFSEEEDGVINFMTGQGMGVGAVCTCCDRVLSESETRDFVYWRRANGIDAMAEAVGKSR